VADLLAGDDKGIALRGAAQGAAGADGKLASEVGVPDEHSLVQDLHEPCVQRRFFSMPTTPWRTSVWVVSLSATRCISCSVLTLFYRDFYFVTPLLGKERWENAKTVFSEGCSMTSRNP
jgi:hypothetical protein